MNDKRSPLETDLDLISSATSGEDVISALARRGCADLTTRIDLASCTSLPLSGGGFCDVYQGSMNDGAKIAIKSLRIYDKPGKENEKAKILKRAARELYYWSKLKHPNVLQLMGLAMFRGNLSMISGWMENGSLMSYINLSPGVDRISLCINVCAGLSYIHANNMVHGDLKAANVMVSHSGIAMIADFGNSQLKDLTLRFTNTTSSSLSVRWAAPELLDGDDDPQVSKESDVYAYGMTVLETLTGNVPFEEFGERRVLSLVALKRQTPARPTIGVSDEIWAVLQRCWTWEHTARPDTRSVEKQLRYIYFQTWVKARAQSSLPAGTSGFRLNESAMPEAPLDGTTASEDPSADHKEKLLRLSDLAKEQLTQGRPAESELLAAEVLAVQKRVLGVDHSDTLQSMHNLATTYEKRGRPSEAESLWVELVAARTRLFGGNHLDTLQCKHSLAATYEKQGRPAEAASLFVEVVAARKRALGVDHPDTLQSMHNLMVTREKQGQLAGVRSLGLELVAVRTRVLGVDHPDTLRSIHCLATIYLKQDQLTEAQSLWVKAVADQKRVLGENHPDTLRSMHSMAIVYLKRGQLAEAQSLGSKVVSLRQRSLGEGHPDTLQSMHNLAVTYEKQGRLAEAASLGARVVEARTRVLGEDHLDTLWSMHSLADTYDEQGRRAMAESLRLKVVAARKRILGADHPDTQWSMRELAAHPGSSSAD